jgi:hypothetical protein
MSKKLTVIESVLNELKFEPENFDETRIEETTIYKFIIDKIDIKDNLGDNFKRIAVKLLSRELYRQDQHGDASVEIETVFDLLVDRDEEDYIEMFLFYYGLIEDFKIQKINNVQLITGTNYKLELNLFLQILSTTIVCDLELVLQKVKMKLYNTVRRKDWYTLLGGKECDAYAKERIDTIIESVLL